MDELIADFLTETTESLESLDQELIKLEQNPDDSNLISSIFRLMHTIKGTCGFIGLKRLERVAHSSENVMGKLRDGTLKASPEIISVILASIDIIKNIVNYIKENEKEPEGSDDELITKLNNIASTTQLSSTEPLIAPQISEEPKLQTEERVDTANAPASNNINSIPEILPNLSSEANLTKEVKKEAISFGIKVAENHNTPAKSSSATASTNQTIRVNLNILEGIMQMMSELVLTRNQLLQIARANKNNLFNTSIQRLNIITSELQEKVMQTRMQPINNAWAQFPRLIRDLSLDLNKKINLKMVGEDTELDRQLIESIKDPLTHMIRNSADHGIELPGERTKNGKSEAGTITLKAYHQGGHIIIEVSDDGRGISLSKIKKKALEKELATETELNNMTDQQIAQFIFKAGFSTAEKVTAVSGRGVGMDVVKTNIEKISGTIEFTNKEGKGCNFKIKIPLTLAIMPILIVEASNSIFGIPQINVVEMVRIKKAKSEYKIEDINGKQILRLRDMLLPLISLSEILKIDNENTENKKEIYIVVCESGGNKFGIIVDQIFDTEEIVVKPVSPLISHINVYSGSTLLGDGGVIMILDPNGLLKSLNDSVSSGDMGINKEETINQNKNQHSSFLIIKTSDQNPKAIPLELISRLEEIDVKSVEHTANNLVVQYRDSLMYLASLEDNFTLPKEGILHVVVFFDKQKVMGLIVNEIIDIVEQNVEIISTSKDSTYIGNMVIAGKATDLIDTAYLLSNKFPHSEEEKTELLNIPTGPSILLIDDSPFFRKFIPPSLKALGYNVETLSSGKEALISLESGKLYDLIITDINMPEMSGIEFADICNEHPIYAKIPIIALSSNSSENMLKDINLAKGLKGFVPKTNHDELIRLIEINLKNIKVS